LTAILPKKLMCQSVEIGVHQLCKDPKLEQIIMCVGVLGCAFRWISTEFRRKLAKSHRQEKNVKVDNCEQYWSLVQIPKT